MRASSNVFSEQQAEDRLTRITPIITQLTTLELETNYEIFDLHYIHTAFR